jgi:multiple sugar transport system permease protein
MIGTHGNRARVARLAAWGVASVFAAPLVWLVIASFLPAAGWGGDTAPTLENYRMLGERVDFWLAVLNSVFVASAVVLLQWGTATAAGFVLALHRFRGRRTILGTMLILLVVPGELLLAPQYQIVHALGLVDTSAGLVLPMSVSALGVLYFTRVIGSVPSEILAAARADGCGEFALYRSVVLPMIRPASAVFCLISFISAWNAFVWPSIVLHRSEMFTLPLAVSQMVDGYREDYGALMAGTLLSVLPAFVVLVLLQRGARGEPGSG